MAAMLTRLTASLRSCPINRRLYGSAAQMQYEYDDSEYESSSEMEDSLGSVSGRGVQWVVMGDHRQLFANKLSKLLNVPSISMGTLVRQELNPRSDLYKKIASAVNEGKLVPEEVIFGLLSKRLEEGFYRGETGFILDGIPRTPLQAEILDQVADIDLVLNFKCTEGCLQKHHVARYQDILSVRNSMNNPLEDYYKKQKKLLNFNVAGAPGRNMARTFGYPSPSTYECSQLITEAECIDALSTRQNSIQVLRVSVI